MQKVLYFLLLAWEGAPWGQNSVFFTKITIKHSPCLYPVGDSHLFVENTESASQGMILSGMLPLWSLQIWILPLCWVLYWWRQWGMLECKWNFSLHLEHKVFQQLQDAAGKIFIRQIHARIFVWAWKNSALFLCIKPVALGYVAVSVVGLWLFHRAH